MKRKNLNLYFKIKLINISNFKMGTERHRNKVAGNKLNLLVS